MTGTIREVVAVFDDAEALEEAVLALEVQGFDHTAFSLLADEATVESKLGHRYRRVVEMEDKPTAPRETFFSWLSRQEDEYGVPATLAGIGALAHSVVGPLPVLIAAGGGAAIGAVLGGIMHYHNAQRIQEQLARGGLLLWVNVRDAEQEKMAVKILKAHSAHDVHVHEISKAAPPRGSPG